MIRHILHWRTDAVIWSGEADTVKDAIHAAIAADADLTGANLTDADLMDANLRGANLRGADLTGANLTDADLMDANLRGADLIGANLMGANLRGANLTDADLRGADLTDADLMDANLRGADLTDADLTGADLMGANLRGAKHLRLPTGETWIEYLTETVPALLTAGGKSLDSFAATFACHSWENCPMAHAFDGHDLSAVPILLRPRAAQFIQLFDARQIPWPLPTRAELEAEDAS